MAKRRWWLSVGLLIGLAGCGSGGTAENHGMTEPDPGAGGAGPGAGGSTEPPVVVSVRPPPAVPVFDDTVLHQLSMTMTPEDWQSIIDDTRADEWRHATLVYDGVTVADVGVRPSGESSRFPGNQKMSLRIRFDAFPDHGKFGDVDVLKLKGNVDDSSMIRDRLSYFVFRKVMP